METSLPTPMTARVELLIYQRVSSGNFSPFAIGYIYRMGPPSDVCGFINHEITPINYSYIYHKATEIRQLSYLGGPTLYGNNYMVM